VVRTRDVILHTASCVIHTPAISARRTAILARLRVPIGIEEILTQFRHVHTHAHSLTHSLTHTGVLLKRLHTEHAHCWVHRDLE
jgi:hypothetical protein